MTTATTRRRTTHAARDERRIDQLQALATEVVGRGAAVGIHPALVGHRVIVFSPKGEEVFAVESANKTTALDRALRRCRELGRGLREASP